MSPSLQTMGFFMSDINFCNTKEQLTHLGEVVTGKVDGSPTGADIDTSTLPYTGQVRKTLPALEGEYEQSITDKEAEADAAIDEYRLLNKGPYASGITLESKFEYITYNGESYFATNPPYITTATTPDADGNLFAGGYLTSQQLSIYTNVSYKASGGNSAVENMTMGVPISPNEGDTVSTGATSWKIIAASSTRGLTLSSGLKAISLNGLWIDDFGCIADGARDPSPDSSGKRNITGTDNSAAYKTVVDAWLTGAGKTIIANYGQYNFVDSGILSYANGQTQNGGYTLKGQGGKNQATYFMMTTEGGGKWFYDNGDGNSVYQFNKYEGICFGSSNPANASFMRMWSNGYEQGFTYTDVQVEYVREVTRTEGNANASELKWYNSKFFYTTSSILTLNNTQSINHEFYGCDAEVILGNIIALDTLGGGSVKWNGGSIILDGSIPGYLVKNFAGGGGVGTNNQDFTFTGIKTELKDNAKGIVDADNPAGNSITVKFLNSNLTVVEGTTPREAVSLKSGHAVRFDNCEMPQEFQYTISGNNEATDNNGLLEFENCKDFKDLPSRISISNFFGSAKAREGVFVDTAGSGDSPQYATDFDVNPTNNGRGTYSSIKKSASLMQNRVGWPYNSINEQSIVIPDNSVITKITVYRPPAGGSSSSYTLKVGSNDKATEYGASTTTQQRFDHSFVVDNLNLNVGTDANKKQVRLWADGGDTAISSAGFVVVEYI